MPGLPPAARAWADRLRPHWVLLPGLLVGGLLRLRDLPTYLYGDEAEYALVARTLASDPWRLAYPAIEGFGPQPWVSQPPLLLHAFAWAGRMAGDVDGPLLVSALLGTLTIPAVYGIGLLLRDRWLGAAAALLLAFLPYHIAVSRMAQLDAGFTFFATLTLMLLLAWLRSPRPRWAFATGAAAACTAFAKLPGVLVVAALVAILAVHAWPDWRRRNDPVRGPEARRRLAGQGRLALVAGFPVALAAVLYLGQLWILRATGNLTAKLGWQADRVSGVAPGTVERDWVWYFTSEVGLWVQWGFGLAFLAAAGAILIAGDALRNPATRPGRLALLLWPLPMAAFLLMSARKEWFYAMPLAPIVVLWAAWTMHSTAAAAHRASRPQPGQQWWQTVGSVAAVVGLLAVIVIPLVPTVDQRLGRDGYGDGLREAALYIAAEDPAAGQVGTMLGRYSLHFYNGHATYHYFVNHTWLDGQVETGRVRYVVDDPYLNLTYEREWIHSLVARHNGTLAASFDNGHGRSVDVYRLA